MTDNPTEGRSSTLVYYKKTLLYFMPNKLHKWTVINSVGSGKPTKSQQVNDLIAAVIKKETRGLGMPSNMDRPLTKNAFSSTRVHESAWNTIELIEISIYD